MHMMIYEKKVVCNDREMEISDIDYEKKHRHAWSEIIRFQDQIQRIFSNCWYPYSIKLFLVKRFIPIYREHLSFLEEYLSLSPAADTKLKLEKQIESTQGKLHDFEEQLNELYLRGNTSWC